jgi:hypothetical protein
MKLEFERFMNFFYNILTLEERSIILNTEIKDEGVDESEDERVDIMTQEKERGMEKEKEKEKEKETSLKRKSSPNTQSETTEKEKVPPNLNSDGEQNKKKVRIDPLDSTHINRHDELGTYSDDEEWNQPSKEKEDKKKFDQDYKPPIIHNDRENPKKRKLEKIDLRVYFKLHPFEKVDHELLFRCLEKDILDKTVVEKIIKEALNVFK